MDQSVSGFTESSQPEVTVVANSSGIESLMGSMEFLRPLPATSPVKKFDTRKPMAKNVFGGYLCPETFVACALLLDAITIIFVS